MNTPAPVSPPSSPTAPTASAADAAPPASVDPADIDALRAFNRFYTQRIGVLNPYLDSAFSLTEVRVLYELAHHGPCTGVTLARALNLDAGYLSRLLRRFTAKQWIAKQASAADARVQDISLTAEGRRAFEPLQQRSREEMARVLAPLPAAARRELVVALQRAQALLAPGAAAADRTVVLREPRAGDMGWVIEQHGALYQQEFGWNGEFETLVAEIVAGMMQRHDPLRERGFIAELNGERVGCAFVVRGEAEGEAKLRLVILSPAARGLGLGGRLTDECIAFARAAGYRKMVLWTHANLVAARAIYARRGFQLVASEPYRAFGQDLVSEHWERPL